MRADLRTLALVVAGAFSGATSGAPLLAEGAPCTDAGLLLVEDATDEERAQICDVVRRARPRLAECHLRQSRALTIRVVDRIAHPFESCMAQYDCREKVISVTDPEKLPEMLATDSIWRRIAPAALFDSLIVHELAHAFLDQTECLPMPCLADQEYIGYALQIDALDEADRAAILAGNRIGDPADTGRLNDFMALAGPNHFAQAAWLHFSLPGNGCAFVGELVDGTVSLSVGLIP